MKDDEQLAHVRSQIIDYGSICEGLLHDMIRHALDNSIMRGQKYLFTDTANMRNVIRWSRGIDLNLNKQSFHWHINVSEDEGIINSGLRDRLHQLRKDRNTVHLHSRTYKAFLGASMSAYKVFLDTVDQTRTWKHRHP